MSFSLTPTQQRKRVLGAILATVLTTGAFAAPITAAYADTPDSPTSVSTEAQSRSAASSGTITVAWKDLTGTTGYIATDDASKLPKADGYAVKDVKGIAFGKYTVTYTATESQPGNATFTYIPSVSADKDGKVSFDGTTTKNIALDSGKTSDVLDLSKGGMLVFPKSDVENGTFTINPVFDETTKPDTPATGNTVEVKDTLSKSFKELGIAAGDYTVTWSGDNKATFNIFKIVSSKEKSAPAVLPPDYVGTLAADGSLSWTTKDGKTVDHISVEDSDVLTITGNGTATFNTYKASTSTPDPEAKSFTFNADADTPFYGTLDSQKLTEGNYKVSVTPNAKDGSILAKIGEPDADGKVTNPLFTIEYAGGSAGKNFTVHSVADNVDSANQVLLLKPTYGIELTGGSVTFTQASEGPKWTTEIGTEETKPIRTYDIDLSKIADANGDRMPILGLVPLNGGEKLPSVVVPKADDQAKADSKDEAKTPAPASESSDTVTPTDKTDEDKTESTEKPADTTKSAYTFADQFQALQPGTYRITFTASDGEAAAPALNGVWYNQTETKDGVFNKTPDAKSTTVTVRDGRFDAVGEKPAPTEQTLEVTKGGVLYLNAGENAGTVHLALIKAAETPKDGDQQQDNKLAHTGVGILASILGITSMTGAGAGFELLRRKKSHAE
ncbi:hypothetical protein [Bifidobacterium callitrichidarum]|uniref:Uncharacterized protein n=1 Tax=Bifidobacterium callitrichidarum TaxID=2052941 RepID=A0A2U2NBY7_9BIFI|nr:hypothetical protein [Bifidobacterium callitrichidarum]PWG66661.1 hypothetical protein DF196_01805 [Bifidobacterium callitrichidarum]